MFFDAFRAVWLCFTSFYFCGLSRKCLGRVDYKNSAAKAPYTYKIREPQHPPLRSKCFRDVLDKGQSVAIFGRARGLVPPSVHKRVRVLAAPRRRWRCMLPDASELPRRSSQAHRLGEEVIVAENLRKEIGDRVLIDDLSFEVPRASVVGIVGANGAGKSTLIKMLTGQEPVTAGEVKVGGTVKLASVDQAREELDAKGKQTVFEAICGERETLDLGEREVNARAYVSASGSVWKSTGG